MGQTTDISWCDSTLNLEMGCDGCELWIPEQAKRHCYSGVLTARYAGRLGWPESFEKRRLFLHRLDEAVRLKLSDMSSAEIASKLGLKPGQVAAYTAWDTNLQPDWVAPSTIIAQTPAQSAVRGRVKVAATALLLPTTFTVSGVRRTSSGWEARNTTDSEQLYAR
jgi:hypothetical protein